MKRLSVLFFLVFTLTASLAQKKVRVRQAETPEHALRYENLVYIPEIKTVEFHNSTKEQSLPVFTLGSSETLILGFDDLRAGTRNITYSIEHCDSEWKSSRLSPIDYLE